MLPNQRYYYHSEYNVFLFVMMETLTVGTVFHFPLLLYYLSLIVYRSQTKRSEFRGIGYIGYWVTGSAVHQK